MAKIALLIAVGQFESGDLASLPKSSADVDAMKEVLIDPELGGFNESDITVLKNPKKQRMEDAIYDLFDKGKRKKEDLLLFYFSGHGITDEHGIFFFSTYETRKENGKLRPTTAISSNFVHQWMNQSLSKRMAIILDCCHSGAFAKGLSAKGTANDLIKEQLGGEGRAILTAASATEYAWAKDEFNLSVYTYYLLEGVCTGKADQGGNDWISLEELHEYAKNEISEAKLEMTPEFYPVREGAKIHLFKTKIIDPKEKYRKEIQRYLKLGKIPLFALNWLEDERKRLQISQEEAQSIEGEVFAPLQNKQENLKKYEKALAQALAEGFSLDNDWIWEELKLIQKRYELTDEEVEPIREKIIPEIQQQQKQKEPQEQEEYNNKLRQYQQEFSKVVEREYPLSSHARQQINSWQQSLGLRYEDTQRIEQPILAAKYQEKLKEEERRKEQEAEKNKQLELQKQREQEEYQKRLEERLKQGEKIQKQREQEEYQKRLEERLKQGEKYKSNENRKSIKKD
ncbi:peptidase C14 caspase catalytic subunit p20 [Crinalium epipsammum PCC 9333]|uniref:Peptidase C14 caspase catalytic subunit p20 n=1 Tax=Crinalium epipsammum PCC 9333 TaxID=1173022 RepID=K9W3G3_9CYAN|nr:caspase family protein [Crinalium epipsammum]AFZ14334.1 peptidase C14 caspase catalytic subunit p20 [Crinalium epipsammum PCC 9333]